ncbi:hypothetical protein OIV83_003398 [Microbotryomycetes sp. JL201]|nr:hypothetical protein OIV83_003398 [Microbotryomycetes sp. JL201]
MSNFDYSAPAHANNMPGVVNGRTQHYNDARNPTSTVVDFERGTHQEPSSYEPGVIPPHQRQDVTFQARDSSAYSTDSMPVAGPALPPVLTEPIPYSNAWYVAREKLQVYFAEFLGTLILVTWGEGTQAQVVASRRQPSDYLSIAFGWGVGFMLAVYVSSGISGGHVNPAVTISLAVFRKFPWRKVPGYMLAQLLGAFVGAGIVYGKSMQFSICDPSNYFDSFEQADTAKVMVTGPAALVPNTLATFFSVFIGGSLLMGAISAFTDTGNNPSSPGLTPLLLGFIMIGIASAFGYSTGFVLNPARDMGPRLFIYAVGEANSGLWLDNDGYGIWIPTVATVTGALFGNLVYDMLIYKGRDSPVNYNFSREGRKMQKERDRLLGVKKPKDAGVVNRDRYRRDSVHHHHHGLHLKSIVSRHGDEDGHRHRKFWRADPLDPEIDTSGKSLSGVTVAAGNDEKAGTNNKEDAAGVV